MANDIRYKNFKKFPKECIIKRVPIKEYMDNMNEYMATRHGDYLDILKEGGSLSFMPSSEGMVYFDDNHPDLLRVNWTQENVIGGHLLTEDSLSKLGKLI